MFVPPVYMYFIFASAIASLSVFYRVSGEQYPALKMFPFFLFLTLGIEIVANILSQNGVNNLLIYSLFSVAEFSFYMFFIRRVIVRPNVKRVIGIMILAYLIYAPINIFLIQVGGFHTMSYSIGCLLAVSCSIYYFFEIFRLPPKQINLLRTPPFWVCTGILFYYSCGLPLFGLVNYWSGVSKLLLQNFEAIVTTLNIFLYTLLTIAFLCTRIPRSTLSPS